MNPSPVTPPEDEGTHHKRPCAAPPGASSDWRHRSAETHHHAVSKLKGRFHALQEWQRRRNLVVLLCTGSFCPVTLSHLQLFSLCKDHLENVEGVWCCGPRVVGLMSVCLCVCVCLCLCVMHSLHADVCVIRIPDHVSVLFGNGRGSSCVDVRNCILACMLGCVCV